MSEHTPAEGAFAFAMGQRHAELMKELDALRKQRDDLLEALKLASGVIRSWAHDCHCQVFGGGGKACDCNIEDECREIDAAIAKAEGEGA